MCNSIFALFVISAKHCIIFLFLFCSIAGNPLLCKTGQEQGCYGTVPMPISFDVNVKPGNNLLLSNCC